MTNDFRKKFLTTSTERAPRRNQLDPAKMREVGERQFEEAILAHYDELGDLGNYKVQLKKMRDNGMEPKGDGRPLPGTPFYDYGR